MLGGLKLIKDRTSIEKIEREITGWGELVNTLTEHFPKNGYIVAYLHYKVLLGKLIGGKPKFFKNETFNPKYLLKLRAFNENQELFIWQHEEYFFKGRLRIDGEGHGENEGCKNIVEVEQVLWGTDCKALDDGWVCLFEKRGTELIFPPEVKVRGNMLNPKNRLKIKTRYYIGYNDMGQAGYEDCRFVEFTGTEV